MFCNWWKHVGQIIPVFDILFQIVNFDATFESGRKWVILSEEKSGLLDIWWLLALGFLQGYWPFFFHIASSFNSLKTFLVHAGLFGVSMIQQTLTWITGSSACMCDLFALVGVRGLGFKSQTEGLLQSAQNLTPEQPWSRHKAWHLMVAGLVVTMLDASSCLTA